MTYHAQRRYRRPWLFGLFRTADGRPRLRRRYCLAAMLAAGASAATISSWPVSENDRPPVIGDSPSEVSGQGHGPGAPHDEGAAGPENGVGGGGQSGGGAGGRGAKPGPGGEATGLPMVEAQGQSFTAGGDAGPGAGPDTLNDDANSAGGEPPAGGPTGAGGSGGAGGSAGAGGAGGQGGSAGGGGGAGGGGSGGAGGTTPGETPPGGDPSGPKGGDSGGETPIDFFKPNTPQTIPGEDDSTGGGEPERQLAPVSAAPEPGAWMLMVVGVGALGMTLRRRRSLAV